MDLLGNEDTACPVCLGDCIGFPDRPHPHNYPLLPGGIDPLADEGYVIATRRIDDPELERVVYGVGDRVPMADAIKYGLVAKPKKTARAKKGPEHDRAKRPAEDRE